MLAQYLQCRLNRMHDNRLIAHPADRIDHEGYRRYVIEMRVGNEHVIDARQFVDTQVAGAGAGIDQDVVVEQHRGGAQVATDAATATKYPEFHRYGLYFVLNVNA